MSFYKSGDVSGIECVKKNEIFKTIEELYKLLESHGWEEMTVYRRNQWNSENKCVGQCNATALLVQEFFGGEIIKYPIPSGENNKKMHYFNRISEIDIDLTSEQFEPKLKMYSEQNEIAKRFSNRFSIEKSVYILKINIGIIKKGD